MCRLSVIRGSIPDYHKTRKVINDLQEFGSTVPQELFSDGDVSVFLNRFDVTTSDHKAGTFPLENDELVFAYNGEVYSFGELSFRHSTESSDGHFAWNIIIEHGHKKFFEKADFEGTFVVFEKKSRKLFVYTDQLNTKGCFYAATDRNIFITQEISIMYKLLDLFNAREDIEINALKRGHRLCVFAGNKPIAEEYKPDFKKIWSGNESTNEDISKRANRLYNALRESIKDRIPKSGLFGVLCGGGIDSSLLLKITIEYLEKKIQLHRLRIFTLGTPSNPLTGEDNDLINVNHLLKEMGPTREELLHVVFPMPRWNEFLLQNKILTDEHRLITPNPMQTQVRHTMTMSSVLAQVALLEPDIKVVLTGDFADELFGGYNSMNNGNWEDLLHNIQDKLEDLFLNDASRVTLASLYGCKYLLKNISKGRIQGEILRFKWDSYHPIEIRTPFCSTRIAEVLKKFPPSDLVGRKKDKTHSKYILRLAAELAQLPEQIAWRKKIPFNEGGTGVRNAEPDLLEENLADKFLKERKISSQQDNKGYLRRLGIKKKTEKNGEGNYEYAIYHASIESGLEKLLRGNAFRESMPDSNYSTKGDLSTLYMDHLL